jgi:hypothetical protein
MPISYRADRNGFLVFHVHQWFRKGLKHDVKEPAVDRIVPPRPSSTLAVVFQAYSRRRPRMHSRHGLHLFRTRVFTGVLTTA